MPRVEVPAGAFVAGFRVLALVGEGAMGAVYLAEDASGRRVALKVLASEVAGDERFQRRFLREVQLAAQLDHPHIVATVAAGEDDGVLYLAMAYVEGEDLREVLRREGRLEAHRAVDLLGQVADALDAAHRSGLVHRDVKPGNILVAGGPGGEQAYICDFGLARHVSSVRSLTGDRGFVGTIDYVPPEQIRGGSIDRRADVYSLGCVLFECLAGARPFERDSELAVVFAHLNESPPRISQLRPELPETLDSLFATALAKSPGERHASCGELIRAVGAALRGETIGTRRLPRRRYLAAAAVLAVAGPTAGALVAIRHDPSRPPVSISETSIAGATLGLPASAYKRRYGAGWREDVFVLPEFRVLIFQIRRAAVYFDDETHKAVIITTWNKSYRTAAGVGPCSTIDQLKSAYGDRLKPSRWNTQKGKVYAYTLGKNLMFAANGKPPHPSKIVTAVALYDGNGPRNDGTGVDVAHGTRPFAGFVALSEISCA